MINIDVYEMIHVDHWPQIRMVMQIYHHPSIIDIQAHISCQMQDPEYLGVRPGMTVAVAVGSRGINGLDEVVRAVISGLKQLGAKPFIVPAMGSHGGACADGQIEVLNGLGINEQTMGVPIANCLDVEVLDRLPDGMPIYTSRAALGADGIVVINRIKNHTSFRGKYESGLLKMMVVGLGCHAGAMQFHELGFINMAHNLVEMGSKILKKANVLFGVGIVENANEKFSDIRLVPGNEILDEEPLLLNMAKALSLKIPFTELDILAVRQIGKDISGDGMDPNVTGRYTPSEMISDYTLVPDINKIVTFDLTDCSHGSGIGLGNSDVTTRRAISKVDWDITYMNALSATVTNTCKIPIVMPNERNALEAAIRACRLPDPSNLKLCIIQDTRRIQRMYVTEALVGLHRPECSVRYGETLYPMSFDIEGNLLLPESLDNSK